MILGVTMTFRYNPKEIVDKLHFIKYFCSTKDNVKRIRRQAISQISTACVTKEMQLTERQHYTTIRMAKTRALTPPDAGEDGERQEVTSTAGGDAGGCSHSGRQFGSTLQTKPTLTIRPNNYTPWCLPKGAENLRPHKNLHTDVYSSFTHNCQNLEATKMPFSG